MAKPGDAYDFGAASAFAAASTAMTLWHRLPMFGLASFATAAQRQSEMARMVDEKAAAGIEGFIGASMETYRLFTNAMMGQFAPLMNAPIAIANAGLKPAFRTVNANAKRLNRHAIKSAIGG